MRREMRDGDDGGEVQGGGADEDALRDASVVPDPEVQYMGVSGAGPALRGAATRLPRVPSPSCFISLAFLTTRTLVLFLHFVLEVLAVTTVLEGRYTTTLGRIQWAEVLAARGRPAPALSTPPTQLALSTLATESGTSMKR